MRTVIAIDPGNEHSAWCVLVDGSPLAVGKDPNGEILGRLRLVANGAWDHHEHLLAIEMIASYGMPVGREVFETVLWIGRFMEAWASRGGEAQLVYRKDVKLFHCESARATDANIRAALIDRFGPGKSKAIGTKAAPGPLHGITGDQWSALAVALTAEAQYANKSMFDVQRGEVSPIV